MSVVAYYRVSTELKLGAFALQLLLAELSGAVGAAPAGTPAP